MAFCLSWRQASRSMRHHIQSVSASTTLDVEAMRRHILPDCAKSYRYLLVSCALYATNSHIP